MPSHPETPRQPDRTLASGDPADHSTHGPYAPPAGPTGSEPLPDVPGYAVSGVIARGGMGVVYRAVQLGLNRPAALKLLHGWGDVPPAAEARFAVEAAAVALLDHPHVVGVYEFGRHRGAPFLAMELVDGPTLKERLKGERFTPRAAAELLAKVADGMAAAHARGVIHRDLKPSNVMLTPAGEPKVADFGLARIGAGEVTAAGELVGTPGYMAPEQAAGRVAEVGTASDVWALGCILYRLLAGRAPFEGESPAAIVHRMLNVDPDPPRQFFPDVPRDLETICLKCLEKEPKKRYPTADALAAELRAFLAGKPVSARPVGNLERTWKWAKRHPLRAAAVAAGVLLAVAAWATVAAVRQAIQEERGRAAHVRRQTQAEAAVQALAGAEPAAVPVLLDRLAEFRDLAGPPLREMADKPIDTRSGLNARFALLPDQPARRRELLDYSAACRADELPLFALVTPSAADLAALWETLDKARDTPPRALRAAALLAAWDADSPRWQDHAPTVAGHVVGVTPREVDAYARALRPVRAVLRAELRRRYVAARARIEADAPLRADLPGELNRFEVNVSLLVAWSADRPAELADLAVTVVDRHYPLIAEAVKANQAAVVPLLLAELDNTPHPDWAEVESGRLPVEPAVAAAVGTALERAAAVPDAAVEEAARRRAYAAAALFLLGAPKHAWPLFAHSPDPTARSHLVARLPAVGADPLALVRRYETDPDVSARRAVLSALGDFPPDVLPAPFRADRLAEYTTHPDAGLHATLDWLLRTRWGMAGEVAAVDGCLRGGGECPGRDWFVNEQGQTFAVVRGPRAVFRGSPVSEVERTPEREPARRHHLDHSFAVAAREVSLAEFRRFRPDHPVNPFNKDPDSPAVMAPWYLACEYCNWLSAQDGIPEDQWCYVPNPAGEYAAGMTVKANRLALRGYRLPTEDEWECGCRAGAVTARFFGRGHPLLGRYAWYEPNTKRKAKPGGGRRPNDFGLFDTLGNVWEWTEDAAILDEPGRIVATPSVTAGQRRVYRGGSFFDDAGPVRAGNRNSFLPGEAYYSIGIRPVRTIPD